MKHAFHHLIRWVSQLVVFRTNGRLFGSGQQLSVMILHTLVYLLKPDSPDFRLSNLSIFIYAEQCSYNSSCLQVKIYAGFRWKCD
jgi:hypothetical protein